MKKGQNVGISSLRGAPSNAEWLATMRCSLCCSHCAAEAGDPWERELDTVEAVAMLGQLSELGVGFLTISGGEFTSRPDWQKLLRVSLARFRGVTVMTNGQLGAGMARILEGMKGSERLTLMVSVDGLRETHDVRRGHGAWDKAMRLIRACKRIRKDIITAVDSSNVGELDEFAHLALELGAGGWHLQPCIPLGRMDPQGCLDEAAVRALMDAMYAIQQKLKPGMGIFVNHWFGYFHPIRGGDGWRGCPAGREQIAILPNGDVSGCVAISEWVCGNIRENSLRKILSSDRMARVRNARPAGCDGCHACPRGCKVVQSRLGRQYCFRPAGAARSIGIPRNVSRPILATQSRRQRDFPVAVRRRSR